MFDLHVHSTASDGDASPVEVAREAARRGLTGFSLTDHNGLWGIAEAKVAARRLGLQFIEGIEITARYHEADVHVLGYSRAFDRSTLEIGLTSTRAGYSQRIQEMIVKAQAAGYSNVTWENVQARRNQEQHPCYVSFDVAREIARHYDMDVESARKLTVTGGVCHVPYGDWALSPGAAVELIHQAGGVASLAHPGTIEREGSRDILLAIIAELKIAGLDSLEIVHPFHSKEYQRYLTKLAGENQFTVTGGSDWHGASHLFENDKAFGKVGISVLPAL